MLIRRLLTGLDTRAFCLLTSNQHRYAGEHIEPLDMRCLRLAAVQTRYLSTTNRWLFGGSALAGAVAGILRRAHDIARAARRERCRGLIAFTGDFHDIPAAFLASRVLRLPLYVYMCDYYSHRELYEPAWRRLSPHLERVVVTRAERVICGNDTLADALAQRYGIDPAVIHHPADLSLYRSSAGSRGVAGDERQQIVYTGTIYDAQLDAVQNLLAAIDTFGEHATLNVYTGQSQDELRANGLARGMVVHPHASATAIAAIQQSADILFLPLAFRSRYQEVVRTSAPMKFGEYLAAGGPILAHAPADSFVSQYCRRHECALVVDEPDIARLAEALETLAHDEPLRARLIQSARTRAVSDFGIDVARARFCEVLNLQSPDGASR